MHMNDVIFNSMGISLDRSPRLRKVLSDKISNHISSNQHLMNTGNVFMNILKKSYDHLTDPDVVEKAKRINMHSDILVNENTIYQVTMDTDFTQLNLKTKRYIMACPEIYEYYNKNMIEGFEDQLLIKRNENPYNRIDYLLAIDEFVIDGIATYTTSIDTDELSYYEKVTIQRNWEVVKELIHKGIDPTYY